MRYLRYLRCLQEQQFGHPAQHTVLHEAIEAMRLSKKRVERLKHIIEEFVLLP